MLDHITLPISNYSENRKKYDAIFSAIDVKCLHEGEGYTGYGVDEPQFWISEPFEGRQPAQNAHIAIAVDSEEKVRVFHETAIAQGWKDNGAPGSRPEYGENYYGAFALDQDGNNIEAVYRAKR